MPAYSELIRAAMMIGARINRIEIEENAANNLSHQLVTLNKSSKRNQKKYSYLGSMTAQAEACTG